MNIKNDTDYNNLMNYLIKSSENYNTISHYEKWYLNKISEELEKFDKNRKTT